MTTFYIQRKKKYYYKRLIQPMKTFIFREEKKIFLLVKKNNLNVSGKIIFLPVKNPFFSSLKIKSFEWLD